MNTTWLQFLSAIRGIADKEVTRNAACTFPKCQCDASTVCDYQTRANALKLQRGREAHPDDCECEDCQSVSADSVRDRLFNKNLFE